MSIVPSLSPTQQSILLFAGGIFIGYLLFAATGQELAKAGFLLSAAEAKRLSKRLAKKARERATRRGRGE